jgi:hypothetical protein
VATAAITTNGQILTMPYAPYQACWAINGTKTNTTDQVIAAAASGLRHCITGIQLFNMSTSVDTIVQVKDGSTVIWSGWLLASATGRLAGTAIVTFPVPLRGTANTALAANCVTTGANVIINVQGYTAP